MTSDHTLAVTCKCGAYLEIDIRFAGQSIQCPDCQQNIDVPARQHQKTSGFALASVLLALLGALIIPCQPLAIVLGLLGLRSIARQPEKLAGRRLALAGITLGVVLLGVNVILFAFREHLGVDGWLREIIWAGKLEYRRSPVIQEQGIKCKLPSRRWGLLRSTDGRRADNVILIHPRDDAHFLILPDVSTRQNDPDEACQQFAKSELAQLLEGRRLETALPFTVRPASRKEEEAKGKETIEMIVDIELGGRERTFLVWLVRRQGDNKTSLVAAGTRKHRFPSLEAQFRQMFDSFEMEREN